MDIMEDLYTTTFSNNESFFKKAAAEIEALRTRIAAQAAVIEKLRKHSALLVEAYNFGQFADDFNQPQAHTIRKAIRETCEALAFPTDSKQVLSDWIDSVLGEPVAWTNATDTYVCLADKNTVYGSHTIPLFKKPETKQ